MLPHLLLQHFDLSLIALITAMSDRSAAAAVVVRAGGWVSCSLRRAARIVSAFPGMFRRRARLRAALTCAGELPRPEHVSRYVKIPYRGKKSLIQEEANRAHARLRAPGE